MNTGRVQLFRGPFAGLSSGPYATIDGSALGQSAGYYVSGAGDFDQDGSDDFLFATTGNRYAIYSGRTMTAGVATQLLAHASTSLRLVRSIAATR